jgi:UrcA family protein
MRFMHTRRLIALGLVSTGIAFAGSALADGAAVHVRSSDLNLNSPQGIQTLYHRIEVAASEACSSYYGAPLPQQNVYHRCVSGSIDSAVAHSGNAQLVAYRQMKLAPGQGSIAVAVNN